MCRGFERSHLMRLVLGICSVCSVLFLFFVACLMAKQLRNLNININEKQRERGKKTDVEKTHTH